DGYYVRVLTLKEPPGQTFAHMLRGLQKLPCQYTIASEWKPESNLKFRKLVDSKRRHFHNLKRSLLSYFTSGVQDAPKDMLIDEAAVAHVAVLGASLQAMGGDGRGFGGFRIANNVAT